ncbi:15450_t:CDS:2, partial [Funneliformis caledonium]
VDVVSQIGLLRSSIGVGGGVSVGVDGGGISVGIGGGGISLNTNCSSSDNSLNACLSKDS